MPLYRFCPHCGAPLPPTTVPPLQVLRQDCTQCGTVHYRNAKPTAGALITRNGRLLLGKRAFEPFKDWWDVPGGFLDPWEEPEDGLAREIREETGLSVTTKRLFAVLNDTYGDEGDYTLNFYYLAETTPGEPVACDDVTELSWFSPTELPERIAFTAGRKVVEAWKAAALHGDV